MASQTSTLAPTDGTETAGGGPDVSGLVDLDGRRFYRIASYDDLPPFFMTLVGASDLWLFISSTGGVTAGREQADRALFTYTTEDKVAAGAGRTGGLTLLRVATAHGTVFWQPFAPRRPGDPNAVRHLYKDPLGTTLVFEETRPDLGLRVRVTWRTAARFGVVREVGVAAIDRHADAEVLDGLVDLLPAGVTVQTQGELSCLLDAYKRAELDDATGLGLVYLNSTLTDKADPSESLATTVAWQVGLADVEHLLSTRHVEAFAAGRPVVAEREVRGEKGAYLVRARLALAPGQERRWSVVADIDQSAADVVRLQELLADPSAAADALAADVARTRTHLDLLVGTADGAQVTGDELAAAHHRANVLFNIMRGGVPADGYTVSTADLRAFVAQRSPRTLTRSAPWFDALGASEQVDDLVERADASGDPDLLRLVREYLPLTFSRRHGDPSRPWNRFAIALTDEHGRTRVDFQGNWRDIFQNWEALAWSFPEYVESMVAVFLDATTADGYNPYRISRSGIDWEVPEPDNPWANIGYWSDHQVIYLVKLLEASRRFHPGRLESMVDRAVFTHADVPYRIATYDQTLREPIATITFDTTAEERVARRVQAEGADGRLVHGPDGDLVRVSLGEKLLLIVLAKLVNLVPDGGIWMNTQRPEWNDANNALVGKGLSVVTLAYLRRALTFARDLLTDDLTTTSELADLLSDVRGALAAHADQAWAGFDDRGRRVVMDALGAAGTAYRTRVYAGFSGTRTRVPAHAVQAFLADALTYVDAALRANRRDDGLYHAYNLLDLRDGARVGHLQEMLEGQVAVLSSGLLTPAEALDLVRALRGSALYRPDQHSYQLYPDRDLPTFLARNLLTAAQAAAAPLLGALVAAGDTSVVLRDVRGDHRFAPGLHNARDLADALDALPGRVPGVTAQQVAHGRAAVLDVFEQVFRHAEFTGRSGSFFAYEGLGSIYWHMVSKLLLAVQENHERAVAVGADAGVVAGLAAAYDDVRRGLGYCKSPEVYGAFPVDPYSHTPAGRGARQPGMTGQVKEEVLARLGELGLRVEDGRVVVRPDLLRPDEWRTAPTTFSFHDVGRRAQELWLPAGSLAFTFCQVPVVYRRVDAPGAALAVVAHRADGTRVEGVGGVLDAATSRCVFRRTGDVVRIDVQVPARERVHGPRSLVRTGRPF
ncbi:conserved hypothetical protein [Cellulomonas flavigena DSM 20109]|uniref:Glycosyl hydrolase 36 catalytic domain-containing protein n=1 Tax=Cellulomonas flavigena (strain ATCC 482 / DSM 20109 / BCRC 11376 / JCM 18109 / NBRC 3775 / NCIMB 8073 / NRS 134) TaxID=446466 RepID=D5UIJ1_CELFN|nr:hypothetical protein [Cellulomonas flavigena]ADG73490.1 conserved hypothetical protein [Cellulomonas flavigena DSM 20109]